MLHKRRMFLGKNITGTMAGYIHIQIIISIYYSKLISESLQNQHKALNVYWFDASGP